MTHLHFFKISIFLIFFYFHSLSPQIHQLRQAQNWIQSYLSDASSEDIKLTANLFYWSYKRSAHTLEVQAAATKSLMLTWQTWANIAETRLNPSRNLIYDIEQDYPQVVQEFDRLSKAQRNIGQTYSTCVDYVTSANNVSPLLFEGLSIIRTESRKIISHALVTSFWTRSGFDDAKETIKEFWRGLPEKAIHSFVDLNDRYNNATHTCWQTFMLAHEKANKLWNIIEENRAQFYLVYYQALYEYIKNTHPEIVPIPIMFDRHGLTKKDRGEFLPEPEYITL